jgi:hypothetical protein
MAARPGARLATRLGMPMAKDTLLRLVARGSRFRGRAGAGGGGGRYKPYLAQRVTDGYRNAMQLLQQIGADGYSGSS